MPVWDYDLTIIGGGPAGLTAGIYAGRARLHALRLEKLRPGGPLTDAGVVATHPGFPEGLSWFELSPSVWAGRARSTAWVTAPWPPSRWQDIMKNKSRAEL